MSSPKRLKKNKNSNLISTNTQNSPSAKPKDSNTPKQTSNPPKPKSPVPKLKPQGPKKVTPNKLSTLKTKSKKSTQNFKKSSPTKT